MSDVTLTPVGKTVRMEIRTTDGARFGIDLPAIQARGIGEQLIIKAAVASADRLHGIDRAAPVMVVGDGPVRTTWGEFVAANGDAILAGDVDPTTIAKALLRRPGCTYHGGGGASAEWTIRLLMGDAA